MKLVCLFAKRYGEDTPELLTAWDEFSIDENRQGFYDDINKQLDMCSDIECHNTVEIEVDMDEILKQIGSGFAHGHIVKPE